MSGTKPGFDVIGLGASTLDLLLIVDELPGDEVLQKAYQSALEGGGPVATAMVTLAKLGARVAMIDRLGDDWRSNLILEQFERAEVSTEFIQLEPGKTATIASILVRKEDGARAISFSPGSAGELEVTGSAAEAISEAKILHLNGHFWEACLKTAKLAKSKGVLVSFDGGAGSYRPTFGEILPYLDICIVAEHFSLAYSVGDSPREAGRQLISAGPKLVIITAGKDGCWVFEKNGRSFHQPAFEIAEVVDTTGAGDVFHGAFLYGLVSGFDLPENARFASAVAAMSVQSLGGRLGIPTIDQVQRFLSDRPLST